LEDWNQNVLADEAGDGRCFSLTQDLDECLTQSRHNNLTFSSESPISDRYRGKAAGEDVAVVECAMTLVSLGQGQEMSQDSIVCLPNEKVNDDGDCRLVPINEHDQLCQIIKCALPTVSISSIDDLLKVNSFSGITDFEHCACDFLAKASHVTPDEQLTGVLKASYENEESRVNTPEPSKYMSHYGFVPSVASASATVRILNELLNSFDEPVTDVGWSASHEEPDSENSFERGPPPLKPMPYCVSPQVRQGFTTQLPKLIRKPGFQHPWVSQRKQCDESSASIVNNSVIDAHFTRSLAAKRVVLENDEQIRRHSLTAVSNDNTVLDADNAMKLQVNVSKSSSSFRRHSKNAQSKKSDDLTKPVCRKTALGLRSNPIKYRPFQIEKSPVQHGK
jgi:hypothetical protein